MIGNIIVCCVMFGAMVCLVVGAFLPRRDGPSGAPAPVKAPRPPPAPSDAAEFVFDLVAGLFYLAGLALMAAVWLSPLLILAYLVTR